MNINKLPKGIPTVILKSTRNHKMTHLFFYNKKKKQRIPSYLSTVNGKTF